MTREDIDNIISIICPNDEDFNKPIISPAYLKKELEALALEQDKSKNTLDDLWKNIKKWEIESHIDTLRNIIKVSDRSDCGIKEIDGTDEEAIMFAINALEQIAEQEPYICDTCKHNDKEWDEEPCDGCCGNHSGYEPSGDTVSLETFKQVMWERDIAIEQLHELGYGLGQKIEPNCLYYVIDDDGHGLCKNHRVLEQEPSGDVISRQAVLELIADYDLSIGQVVKGIHALPSVNPQKIGHWDSRTCKCSECGYQIAFSEYAERKYNYCPNCGAKMVDEQGRSDKE